MTYHPLMGITIFFILLIIAFYLGRKTYILKNKAIKKSTVIMLKKEKKVKPGLISPDASRLD